MVMDDTSLLNSTAASVVAKVPHSRLVLRLQPME